MVDPELVGLRGGDLATMFNALRRRLTVAIVISADAVGGAPIAHGEVDTLYTANLTVKSYLVGERRPLDPGFSELR